MLDYVALGVIFFLAIGATAVIVALGSIPGNIARKRNHPWPVAVSAAGWIGLATGILWPFALVWAFLPVPAPRSDQPGDASGSDDEVAQLRQQIAALQATVEKLQSQPGEADA